MGGVFLDVRSPNAVRHAWRAIEQSVTERAGREHFLGATYFTPLKLDRRIAHERLSRICFIDYDREMALVVEHCDNSTSEIVGVGRLSRLHGINEAEFALVVSDEWQGQGIGTELLRRLVQIGRDEKLEVHHRHHPAGQSRDAARRTEGGFHCHAAAGRG